MKNQAQLDCLTSTLLGYWQGWCSSSLHSTVNDEEFCVKNRTQLDSLTCTLSGYWQGRCSSSLLSTVNDKEFCAKNWAQIDHLASTLSGYWQGRSWQGERWSDTWASLIKLIKNESTIPWTLFQLHYSFFSIWFLWLLSTFVSRQAENKKILQKNFVWIGTKLPNYWALRIHSPSGALKPHHNWSCHDPPCQ